MIIKSKIQNKICIICGKEYKPLNDTYRRKQKYCSKECWSNRKPKIKHTCKYCKNEFYEYENRNRIYCGHVCRIEDMKGRTLSEEHKQNISKANKGFMPVNIFQLGEKHPFWKKDRSIIDLRETKEYNELRINVLVRDDYTCQDCGVRGTKGIRPILHLHHKKSVKDYPELILDIDNCITLCKECHENTDSYLNRWN